MENTFEHNLYPQHSHFFSALSNAVKSIRARDGLKNYRNLELAEVQGLYDFLTECKDYYKVTLKNKANITFNDIPCAYRPKSKFDLLAQNFGGDKHIIYCADKAERFALLAVGYNRCKEFLAKLSDRHLMYLHKTTFYDGMDFIDTWNKGKKIGFIGVWFGFIDRDKPTDFERLQNELFLELDRMAYIPERKTRIVTKSRQVPTQKIVVENYQSWEVVGRDWVQVRRGNMFRGGKWDWRDRYGYVTRQRNKTIEVIGTEYYEVEEEYYTTYDTREKLSVRLTQEQEAQNLKLSEYLKDATIAQKGASFDKITQETNARNEAEFKAYNEHRDSKISEYKRLYPAQHYDENEWETQWLKAYPAYENATAYANRLKRIAPTETNQPTQGENNADN